MTMIVLGKLKEAELRD